MENNISYIFNEAKKLTLEKSRKDALRKRIAAQMTSSDEPIPSFKTWELTRISQWSSSHLLVLVKRPIPAALLIIVLLGGSAASAAEGALPGEALYSFKVNVNEEIASLAAQTPEAKREWNTRRVERRLLEAEELAANGDLSPEATEILTAHIASYVDTLQTDEENETKTSLTFVRDEDLDARLSAHERILTRLVEGSEQFSGAGTILLATRWESGAQNATQAKMNTRAVEEGADAPATEPMLMFATGVADDTAFAPPSFVDEEAAEHMGEKANASYEQVSKLFDNEKDNLSENVRESIEERLLVAHALYENGESELDSGNYESAFAVFKEALGISEEARIVIITSSKMRTGSVESARKNVVKNESKHEENEEDKEKEENPPLISTPAPTPEPMPFPAEEPVLQ